MSPDETLARVEEVRDRLREWGMGGDGHFGTPESDAYYAAYRMLDFALRGER